MRLNQLRNYICFNTAVKCVFVSEFFFPRKMYPRMFYIVLEFFVDSSLYTYKGALCVAIVCLEMRFYASHTDLIPDNGLDCWSSWLSLLSAEITSMPLHLVSIALGTEPRTSCILGNHCRNSPAAAPSPSPRRWVLLYWLTMVEMGTQPLQWVLVANSVFCLVACVRWFDYAS